MPPTPKRLDVLSLPAELTHAQANDCLATLVKGASAVTGVVEVNAAALQRFDSSALAVLLEFQRECTRGGKTLRVQAMPERLRSLAVLYGIEGLLQSA